MPSPIHHRLQTLHSALLLTQKHHTHLHALSTSHYQSSHSRFYTYLSFHSLLPTLHLPGTTAEEDEAFGDALGEYLEVLAEGNKGDMEAQIGWGQVLLGVDIAVFSVEWRMDQAVSRERGVVGVVADYVAGMQRLVYTSDSGDVTDELATLDIQEGEDIKDGGDIDEDHST